MGLDGTVATSSEVSFQKSDFDLIPVEIRIGAPEHSRRIPAELPGEDRQQQKARKGGKEMTRSSKTGTYRTYHTSMHTISRPGALPGPRTRENTHKSGRYRNSSRTAENLDFAIAVQMYHTEDF